MMSQTHRDFISLLRPALTGEGAPAGPAPDALRWREYYELACRHRVQGLMYCAVEAAGSGFCRNLPVETAAMLLSDSEAIRSCHAMHRAAVAAMEKLWSCRGVNAVLVKGLKAAAEYPYPESRVLGDIDWWMPSRDDWDNALDAARSLGAEPRKDSDGDIHYEWAGTVVEHHRSRMDGDVHVLHHACVKGAELRHICDCAAARRNGTIKDPARCPKRWKNVMDSVSDHLLTGAEPSRDAARFLEMTLSGAGVLSRACYFLRICPGYLFRRIAGLVLGRIKRIL